MATASHRHAPLLVRQRYMRFAQPFVYWPSLAHTQQNMLRFVAHAKEEGVFVCFAASPRVLRVCARAQHRAHSRASLNLPGVQSPTLAREVVVV